MLLKKGMTFKGGIHPFDGKALSKNVKSKKVTPGKDVVIPLSQHIGAPAKPVVKAGDAVLKSQLIGEACAFISANVHSSVSGTVKKIEKRLLSSGNMADCIIIENDERYEEVSREDTPVSTKEEIIDRIKDCGVVGMGGACFPTHVKLMPKDPSIIDHIIVNAAECEPYITADYRRMLENPNEVIEGIKIMLSLFDKAKAYIAIEDNKPDVIEMFNNKLQNEERINVAPLKTKYPQGSERHIIYAITGRKINSKKLPADAGCIVDNVDTVYNIYRAVKLNKPVTDRIVTVSGDAICDPGNFIVPIGVSYKQMIGEAGGFDGEAQKLISGGPMMGMALFSLDVPVVKGTSSILAFKGDPIKERKMTNCLNCGKCAMVCPENLVCALIAKAADDDDMEAFVRMHGMECIECGTCNYNCPAGRNITQSVRTMKKKVIAESRK